MKAPAASPTSRSYTGLDAAYKFFNYWLFDDKLPDCLITLQRHKGAYGYFSGQRFALKDSQEITDEIALNPQTFEARTPIEILSTLVHEMCHLWQQHFGKPGRAGYHNVQWVEVALEVGLTPYAVDDPEMRQTGDKVSHKIEPDGRFEKYAKRFLEKHDLGIYVDRAGEEEKAARTRKAASKTRYTCPACELNAWAKPGVNLVCGDCQEEMEPEEAAEPE